MSWLGDLLPDISLPDHIDVDIVNVGPDVEGDYVEGDVVEGDQIESEFAIRVEGNVVPIQKVDRVAFGELPGDVPLEFREDRNEIVLDPENFERDREWEDVVKPALKPGWREEGAVSTRSAYPILLQAERNITDEKVSGIKSFFVGKIFTTDYLLLQSSLTLDRSMNAEEGERMTDEELKRRKRELADKYHDAAYSFPSLCTSGYFDEGGVFREVYWEMESQEGYDADDYDKVFRQLISNKPFVAYAYDQQSTQELVDVVRGKIERLPQYDIPLPYIDVRGIGTSNHQKIRDCMDSIEEDFNELNYDERIGNEELIVRIFADSIEA